MTRPAAVPTAPQCAWLTRREALGLLALGLAGAALRGSDSKRSRVRYETLTIEPSFPLPAGKRVTGSWPAFCLGSRPSTLRPSAAPASSASGAWLRITTAIDDRQPRIIAVAVGGGGRMLGRLDLRFAHAIETFQLELSNAAVAEIQSRGVELRLEGAGAPMWFFTDGDAVPPGLKPHLMFAPSGVDRVSEFHLRVASVESVQAFGWMEGCLLEGLAALDRRVPGARYAAAREAHWQLFVPVRDKLLYEDPRSNPVEGKVYGIEGGLPFADLARRDPRSPWVDLFVEFAQARRRKDGAIQDGGTLSAEGSYTIAYPLATIAAVRRDPALAQLARDQLRLRNERLWHDGAIWLRRMDNKTHAFRGWARGVAWHALGVASSVEPLREHGDTAELEAELKRIAAWVLPLQRADGLWSCFIEDQTTLPDTSGSAGIAAALAMGVRLRALPASALAAARRTISGVQAHLTPDGLVGGVAQSNRGGEALQRSDYRVLGQIGMGLLALLIAECGEVPEM